MLLAGLCWLGWDLYHRQNENYQINSFSLPSAIVSAEITDINRFVQKANSLTRPYFVDANQDIAAVYTEVSGHADLNFNIIFGRSCFISVNDQAFTLTFNQPDFSMDEALNFINDNLAVNASVQDDKLNIQNQFIHFSFYGTYVVFSNQPITPQTEVNRLAMTNADYVVYTDSTVIEKHILANGQEYRVWQDTGQIVRGRPLAHFDLLSKVPASFGQLIYYSSQRFDEDQYQFFKEPNQEAFSWIRNQMVLVKKDSFELLIAPQNERRNLKLILEEQTLKANSDSGQIAFFNLRNFEIMPFATQSNWKQAIQECEMDMKFYTEFEDVNVLANSLPSLLWYLSEIQSSNLIRDQDEMVSAIQRSAPLKSHYMQLTKGTDGAIDFQTTTWKNKINRVYTASTAGKEVSTEIQLEEVEIPMDRPVLKILPHPGGLFVLCKDEIRAYDLTGVLMGKSPLLTTDFIRFELLDLENDDKKEVAIFTKKGLKVFNHNAGEIRDMSVPGGITGGMVVNYDQQYDYRFFLTGGKKILCYNEAGNVVNGWQFAGSQSTLTGDALYGQFNGKDYLVFDDQNGQHYTLNRRGDLRFQSKAQWQILAASMTLTGKNAGTISRLGYQSNHIYNHYLQDGSVDSLKLDQQVTPTDAFWIDQKEPTLIIDEPGRVVLFSQFGYKSHEVLKPLSAKKLLNVEKLKGFYFVFFDNANNRIYLLDQDGKQLTSQMSAKPGIYGLTDSRFYTYDGAVIKEFKLK